ncbi:DedA family protein [Martelella soudanensis]|uniref:DedA family protein n=1 Tax=unclassified Martelella TaxID=2629616 RepID=UPI0015DD8CFF|nr:MULTISPECIES: DedA family protein [unclassified Martelella]
MNEQFLALVPVYGIPVMALIVFLGCLGIPMPAAVIMLFGGSLAASGDLPMLPAIAACFAAASTSDQIGYWVGRKGGAKYVERFAARGPKRQRLVDRAQDYLERRGVLAIFFTRWLLAQFGPYINPVAGAAGMRWRAFSAASVCGQIIWVSTYSLLGFMFSRNIIAVAHVAGNATGFLAAGVISLALFWYITRVLHFSIKRRRRRRYLKPRGRRGQP